jgi:hypothetical protein
MSYKNPRISFADPLAFQKGFQQAFRDVPNIIQQQRDKIEREAKEKEREAQLLDLSQSRGLSAADIGQITGVDIQFNEALQNSINSIVDEGKFAQASAVEQQKMLQQIRSLKAVYGKIGEIAGMDADDWDYRNDSRLTALKTAINNNNVKIEGEGTNMRFVMPDGKSVTTNEISNLRVFDKTPFRDDFNELNENTITVINNSAIRLYSAGKDPNIAIADAEKDYTRLMLAEGDNYMSYLYENELPDEIKIQLGLAKYKDPEILSKLPPDEAGALIQKQHKAAAAYLFSKNIRPNLIDPSKYASEPASTTKVTQADQQEDYYYSVANKLINSNYIKSSVGGLDPVTGKTITSSTKPDIAVLRKDLGGDFEFREAENQPDFIRVINTTTGRTATFNINDPKKLIDAKLLAASKGPRVLYDDFPTLEELAKNPKRLANLLR